MKRHNKIETVSITLDFGEGITTVYHFTKDQMMEEYMLEIVGTFNEKAIKTEDLVYGETERK